MKRLSRTENLALLAEECAECTHAALKLRRILEPGGAPTPVPAEAAEAALMEEIADVMLCIEAELDGTRLAAIGEIMLANRREMSARLEASSRDVIT